MPSDTVELVEYDPSWAELFEGERLALMPIFDGQAVGIEHIGSTSVPGLCAKPIVDVLIGLRDLKLANDQIEGMERLGYHYLGEHGLPGRLFFRKEPRTHHVHVVEHGGEHWERQITFRDALRGSADERRRYDEFKRRLAAQGHPRETYTEMKTPFIREVEARARARGLGRPTV
jgi:GrpB-like predicted nucleotidyltransferase (UPF0157 family)